MSEYRDRLAPEVREKYDAAVKAAGAILATACRDRDLLYLEQGAIAVGRAAYYSGHPMGSPEAIAAAYEERIAEARAAQGQAA